jgi:hypothetical protein
MKKRFLIIFAAALVVAASMAQATPIKSISATTAGTAFSGITGILTMNGVGGINVEDTGGNVVTYGSGSFSLNTTRSADNSSGGLASGAFTGGAFSYKDSASTTLLAGNIGSFSLTETYNGSGMFVGEGYFTVSSGTLQTDFGPAGNMVDISFSVVPKAISNFSTSFNASSNMTILPIPEPMTVGLLSMGGLAILRKKKRELLLSIKQKRGAEK